MVIDKETKMRETLKIMSMKTAAYGLSYFIIQQIFILVIAILLTITFMVLKYITGFNSILFLIVMLFQGVSFTFMSMAITTIFSDSKISVQMGSLILMLPLTLFIGLYNVDVDNPWRLYLGYWLPHFPCTVIVSKLSGVNVNINMPVTWVTMIVLSPIYYGLYWYLEQVVPDTYGISKSCCFCLRSSRRSNTKDNSALLRGSDINNDDETHKDLEQMVPRGDAPI